MSEKNQLVRFLFNFFLGFQLILALLLTNEQ